MTVQVVLPELHSLSGCLGFLQGCPGPRRLKCSGPLSLCPEGTGCRSLPYKKEKEWLGRKHLEGGVVLSGHYFGSAFINQMERGAKICSVPTGHPKVLFKVSFPGRIMFGVAPRENTVDCFLPVNTCLSLVWGLEEETSGIFWGRCRLKMFTTTTLKLGFVPRIKRDLISASIRSGKSESLFNSRWLVWCQICPLHLLGCTRWRQTVQNQHLWPGPEL